MQGKKIFFWSTLGIVILGGLIWFAKPAPSNGVRELKESGALEIAETNFDFGTISMASGNVSHKFGLKNKGQGFLRIEKIYTSCMCTTAMLQKGGSLLGPYGMPGHGFVPPVNQEMGPGEEAVIEVTFDPAAHGPAGVGRIERVVKIETDSGNPVLLNIAAMVTP